MLSVRNTNVRTQPVYGGMRSIGVAEAALRALIYRAKNRTVPAGVVRTALPGGMIL